MFFKWIGVEQLKRPWNQINITNPDAVKVEY